MKQSYDAQYFEKLFKEDDNHWHYDTVGFRIQKHKYTLECLDGKKFDHACEIGCAAGVFTQKLLKYARRIDAFDISGTVIKKNKERFKNRRVNWKEIDFLTGYTRIDYSKYDLMVITEVLHYFDKKKVVEIMDYLSRHFKGKLLISSLLRDPDEENSDSETYESYSYSEFKGILKGRFNIIDARAVQLKGHIISDIKEEGFRRSIPFIYPLYKAYFVQKNRLEKKYIEKKLKECNTLLKKGVCPKHLELVAWLMEAE